MAGKGRATYDDLLNLPENVVGEIIAGELVVSPRPAPAASAMLSGTDVAARLSWSRMDTCPRVVAKDNSKPNARNSTAQR